MTVEVVTTVGVATRVVDPAMVIAEMIVAVVMIAVEGMRNAITVEVMTDVVDTIEISDRFNERLYCAPLLHRV